MKKSDIKERSYLHLLARFQSFCDPVRINRSIRDKNHVHPDGQKPSNMAMSGIERRH